MHISDLWPALLHQVFCSLLNDLESAFDVLDMHGKGRINVLEVTTHKLTPINQSINQPHTQSICILYQSHKAHTQAPPPDSSYLPTLLHTWAHLHTCSHMLVRTLRLNPSVCVGWCRCSRWAFCSATIPTWYVPPHVPLSALDLV